MWDMQYNMALQQITHRSCVHVDVTVKQLLLVAVSASSGFPLADSNELLTC